MSQSSESLRDWPTGFMLIQGNRLESLRGLLTTWLRQHPLHPLENEIILVQSNGIGQWLKLALAMQPDDDPAETSTSPTIGGGCGIAAALDLMLPGRFLWQAYRAVLGDLPDLSAYDKAPLGWRLYRLLGDLDALAENAQEHDWLAPLRGFLQSDDAARRRQQLAERLADLYDQYQVYRADWLAAWQAGQDALIRPDQSRVSVPEGQRWQPLLWRRLRQDMTPPVTTSTAVPLAGQGPAAPAQPELSRADIHTRFLTRARSLTPASRPQDLPRRVVVFGISSLPRQTIDVLEAIAPVCQVMLLVHNPSQHYWGDIVEGRELFRRAYGRTAARKVPEAVDEHKLHLHGHPLLAAWGKQGRDYIRLLDAHDDRTRYEEHFAEQHLSIDLFEPPGDATLLQQLQDDILELRPLHERQARASAIDPRHDRSLEFLTAHGPQREVEILHDQLLAAFADAETEQAGARLHPRDILVMVPDIAVYAPHIEAVFGRLPQDDPRRIPFHITDQGERRRNPLVIGLETLLTLPQARMSVSEVLDLLDIPALRARFGLRETDLPRLRQWIAGANIRWGLDARQRSGLGLPAGLEQNSWRFGLRRMLLGFATGDSGPWKGVEPFDEIGGLEAVLVGRLDALLETLVHYATVLGAPRPADDWVALIADLLDDCFSAAGDADELTLARLREALEQWQQDCARGALGAEPLPLEVVRGSLFAGLDESTLSQRFLAGAVNFATLMPMRAIPFRQIWLLGMNDGDYPRRRPPADFDLMANDYRPGDRSRREDDRYLFLEALLSAREKLVVSWVGRSIRDNAERPPSVLVGQLRDHIAAGWRLAETAAVARPAAKASEVDTSGTALVAALTTEHSLQPFSRRYFEPGRSARLFTYADEWRALHAPPATEQDDPPRLSRPDFDGPISLAALGRFLRHPVRTFYTQRLQVRLEHEAAPSEDAEPFDIDGLDGWGLREQVIAAVEQQRVQTPDRTTEACLDAAIARLARAGQLPLPPFDAAWRQQLAAELDPPLARYRALLADHPQLLPGEGLRLEQDGLVLEDSLSGLRADAEGNRLGLTLQPSALIKDERLKLHHLVRAWPTHLAAQLVAPTSTWLFGPGGAVMLPPLLRVEAEAHLADLLRGYVLGLTELLPLACKTALDVLAAEAGDSKAKPRDTYEGGYNRGAERDEHAGYGRFWPDYAALTADRRFQPLIRQLYAPLLAHDLRQEVF
ncbi:exodeoxyribonuclease V subunit gamma [Thiohalocapsa marina]|uniref:RecBCD enzyme subunit RecC n=1 Tax=Thiohalocapsa marina TaxID=424902 RepID=A0A5M8FTD1_9GAMM|nr:exodeoxyribonuclease V subunit gamma [Thiohalocapsa marina]KAA6187061.1 exodeoxyribonuclease V subunit gamma [Thiohalocapsa marina]